MEKNSKKIVVIVLLVAMAGLSVYFTFFKKQVGNGLKTFTFDTFHGSTAISNKFQFQYPASWHNDGQYFSPQKISYYDLTSVDAPVYYDLVSVNLFETSDLKYQIYRDRHSKSDEIIKIDGRYFTKYDLIDYGTYGGSSAGRVMIFLSNLPISVNGEQYYLEFHWEEKPLANAVPGNDLAIFEKMVATVKFTN